jgi:H+/Cl- antiporter ClcA
MSRMPPLPRLPFALLGLLTLACFGGPLALFIVRGGPSGDWPPDRIVEWIVVGLVFTLVAALFVACVTVGWWYPWPHRRKGAARPLNPGPASRTRDPAS